MFHVTAITHRRDALFQTLSISGKTLSRTDTAQLTTLRTEALVWRALENAIREPVAVYAPPATGGVYNVRCAIRQRNAGEARNAMSAVFACMANVKNVFVVDPDIDVFSDEQMEWAFATRLQPDHDVYVEEDYRVSPLDPSLPEGVRVGSKIGLRSHAAVRRRARLRAELAGSADLQRAALPVGARRARWTVRSTSSN